MPLERICPVCGTSNEAQSSMCSDCMTSIADIMPTDPAKTEPPKANDTPKPIPADMTVIEESIILVAPGGEEIRVRNGDILGREHTGKAILGKIPEVSRKHAQVTRGGDGWNIMDLGSTNGTWLNGKRLEKNAAHILRKGDLIGFSQRCCEMKVK